MEPSERERILQRLPPERRAVVEQNLKRFEALPPRMREQLQRQYAEFRRMPPQQQAEARDLFRRMNEIPEERRRELRREVVRLRHLKQEQREARMAGEAFRTEFNEDERQLLKGLVELLPSPPDLPASDAVRSDQ